MGVRFTVADLKRVYTNPQIANVPDIDPWEAEAYAEPLRRAMEKHGINNRREAAHFLCHVGYETGCLNWLEEFGGAGAWYAPYWGRGTPMLTHRENYDQIGQMMGLRNLENNPGLIGCVNNDPTEWPRNINRSMETACAFWKSRDFDRYAAQGDDGFEPIMVRWLGAAKGHPSYWDRWALYRAMINKLPRPFYVKGDTEPPMTQKQRDKEARRLPNPDGTEVEG
jgi:predicted chitinase